MKTVKDQLSDAFGQKEEDDVKIKEFNVGVPVALTTNNNSINNTTNNNMNNNGDDMNNHVCIAACTEIHAV